MGPHRLSNNVFYSSSFSGVAVLVAVYFVNIPFELVIVKLQDMEE